VRSTARIAGSIAGVAAAGVVAAHELAFRLSTPDPHARLHQLHDTGHSYWAISVALSVALLATGVVLHTTRAWEEGRTLRVSSRSLGLRLALVQLAGFFMLETIERSVHTGGVVLPLQEQVFVVGLVLQLITALIGVSLLAVLTRAVVAVSGILKALRQRDRETPITAVTVELIHVRSRVGLGQRTLRGPPGMTAT
jgi:hypothetical protein